MLGLKLNHVSKRGHGLIIICNMKSVVIILCQTIWCTCLGTILAPHRHFMIPWYGNWFALRFCKFLLKIQFPKLRLVTMEIILTRFPRRFELQQHKKKLDIDEQIPLPWEVISHLGSDFKCGLACIVRPMMSNYMPWKTLRAFYYPCHNIITSSNGTIFGAKSGWRVDSVSIFGSVYGWFHDANFALLGSLLLTRNSFNRSMDKYSRAQ